MVSLSFKWSTHHASLPSNCSWTQSWRTRQFSKPSRGHRGNFFLAEPRGISHSEGIDPTCALRGPDVLHQFSRPNCDLVCRPERNDEGPEHVGRAVRVAAGVFFVGYFLLEIPSNLALHKFGARRRMTRIMVTWGIVALLFTWVASSTQLYWLRFLLGVAEAGFFPGAILYLSLWVPAKYRCHITGGSQGRHGLLNGLHIRRRPLHGAVWNSRDGRYRGALCDRVTLPRPQVQHPGQVTGISSSTLEI